MLDVEMPLKGRTGNTLDSSSMIEGFEIGGAAIDFKYTRKQQADKLDNSM
jgi:hypothetical protein